MGVGPVIVINDLSYERGHVAQACFLRLVGRGTGHLWWCAHGGTLTGSSRKGNNSCRSCSTCDDAICCRRGCWGAMNRCCCKGRGWWWTWRSSKIWIAALKCREAVLSLCVFRWWIQLLCQLKGHVVILCILWWLHAVVLLLLWWLPRVIMRREVLGVGLMLLSRYGGKLFERQLLGLLPWEVHVANGGGKGFGHELIPERWRHLAH